MSIELLCSNCTCYMSAPPDTPANTIVDRMIEEGPWFALGHGETFETMIFAALAARGRIRCPECGEDVSVDAGAFGSMNHHLSAC